MKEVFLKGVSVTDIGFVIFLKSKDDVRMLPIFVGLIEAQSLSAAISSQKSKRPMTHEFSLDMIHELGGKIEKVEIVKYIDDTFYADIHFKQGEKKFKLDGRPTDAIMFAMLSGAKVYVSKNIMAQNGVDDEQELKSSKIKKDIEKNELNINENANDELGVYWRLLEDAIREERYEEASRLKKKIDIIIGDKSK